MGECSKFDDQERFYSLDNDIQQIIHDGSEEIDILFKEFEIIIS